MNPKVKVRMLVDTYDDKKGDIVPKDRRTAFDLVYANQAEFYEGRAKPAPRNKAKKAPANKAKKPGGNKARDLPEEE